LEVLALAKKSIHCKLVTPMAAVVDDQVSYANVPLHDGLMGFLPGRAPLLAALGTGELRLEFADTSKGQGGSRAFLVEGGFVKMAADDLTILAERAIPAESITLAEAEKELASAKDAKDRERARAKVNMARNRSGI
jgi:F-type H+-transporting ATPase subunit epsilon